MWFRIARLLWLCYAVSWCFKQWLGKPARRKGKLTPYHNLASFRVAHEDIIDWDFECVSVLPTEKFEVSGERGFLLATGKELICWEQLILVSDTIGASTEQRVVCEVNDRGFEE